MTTGHRHMTTGPLAELRGIHVLVIDDDQLARHFLRSVLEFSGAIVTAAGTAGGEFLTQLQQLHVRLGRTVPSIALVPAGARNARMRAAGFQMHLMKPVDGDELRAAVLEMARR